MQLHHRNSGRRLRLQRRHHRHHRHALPQGRAQLHRHHLERSLRRPLRLTQAPPATILPPASAASMRRTWSTAGRTPASSPAQLPLPSRRPPSRMAARSRPPSKSPPPAARPQATSRSTLSRPTAQYRTAPCRTAATPARSATSPAAPIRFRPTTLATASTPPATPTPSPSPSAPSPAPPLFVRCSTVPRTVTPPFCRSGATYPYGGFFLLSAQVAGASGQGSATGNITLTDSGTPIDGGTFRLNSTSNTEDQTRSLAAGTHVITAAYSGDASFNASTSSSFTLTITKAPTASALQVNLPVLSAAGTLVLTAQVSARGYGTNQQQGYGASAPSGTVTFSSASGGILGIAALIPNVFPSAASDNSSATLHDSRQPAARRRQRRYGQLHGRHQLRCVHLNALPASPSPDPPRYRAAPRSASRPRPSHRGPPTPSRRESFPPPRNPPAPSLLPATASLSPGLCRSSPVPQPSPLRFLQSLPALI